MQNEFLKLSSSPLMNLDHTKRYSGTKLVEEEPLSQHIIDTIMMGLKIIDHINSIATNTTLDPSIYTLKAVYHDLEEVITGDVPRPLKYYNESTLDSLKNVAEGVAWRLFEDQFKEPSTHYMYWKNAKDEEEGYILKLVDTLVVAHKVIKEVSLLHNYYMLRVAHEVVQYLSELQDKIWSDSPFKDELINNYLFDVVHGAAISMYKIIEDNSGIVEDLNIKEQSMI